MLDRGWWRGAKLSLFDGWYIYGSSQLSEHGVLALDVR